MTLVSVLRLGRSLLAPPSAAVARRSVGMFSTAAGQKTDMFCYQCEQTRDGKGCTTVGVCGKTPETAAMQDLLVYAIKGVSQYAHPAGEMGRRNRAVDVWTLQAMFSTLTNVNFDSNRFRGLLHEALEMRALARSEYEAACKAAGKEPQRMSGPATLTFAPGTTVAEFDAMGRQYASLQDRIATEGADIVGLQELLTYGLKGMCAYGEHAERLGSESPDVYAYLHKALSFLTSPEAKVPDNVLKMALEAGTVNYKVMELLDAGHRARFGNPEPTNVRITGRKGKCILVSGHDLTDLDALLKQTEGLGIDIYTHGEMLPANAYPGLKKYKHLVGNYGGAWQLQKFEFSRFPGPILMTTNCLVEPRQTYKNRIYTTGMVGFDGVKHKVTQDFSEIIQQAQQMEGFTADEEEKRIPIGFGHSAVLANAGTIIDAIKSGDIKNFYVIGGCDGSEGERSYYKKLALGLDKTSVLIGIGCGKYRYNKHDHGTIGKTGIPRMLDFGQCNDTYGVLQVAIALSKALNTDINSLPVNYAISWFEQKAVAVLLTLLSLGVQRIHIGPNLPAFVTPPALDLLVKTFKLGGISTPEKDFGVTSAAD